jgi:hypothetical protein
LEGAEKFFLLPDNRVRRGQLLFQSQAGLRLGEAEDPLILCALASLRLCAFALKPVMKPFAYFTSFAVPSESARGLAHSTTLRAVRMSQENACVMDCGGPPPLCP